MPVRKEPMTNGNKIRRLIGMEMSLPTAETVSWLSNWILVCALIVGVVATYGIVVSANVKERFWDEARQQSNERIARLSDEAAKAKLETEKLKGVVTWRTLSAEQNAAIEKVLSQKPGAVNLRWQDGDPEALFLAIQLSHLFQRSNWQVAPGAFKPANAILFEITVPPVSGENADTLRAALGAGRVGYSSVPISSGGASFNVSTINGAPYLYVGSRKPVVP
jgi:hypothetical protein